MNYAYPHFEKWCQITRRFWKRASGVIRTDIRIRKCLVLDSHLEIRTHSWRCFNHSLSLDKYYSRLTPPQGPPAPCRRGSTHVQVRRSIFLGSIYTDWAGLGAVSRRRARKLSSERRTCLSRSTYLLYGIATWMAWSICRSLFLPNL